MQQSAFWRTRSLLPRIHWPRRAVSWLPPLRVPQAEKNDAVFEELIKRVAPERLADVKKARRRPQNFAKHADNDPQETIEVKPEFTLLRLFIGLLDLGIAFRRQSFRQVIFRTWFTARQPDYLTAGNEAYLAIAEALFGDVDQLSLDDALDVLRAHLTEYDAEDLRARFEKTMAGTEVDWDASLKIWKSPG